MDANCWFAGHFSPCQLPLSRWSFLGGVLAVHAGESLIVWARTAAGMTPTLALNFP
jgi:hypothetical protein